MRKFNKVTNDIADSSYVNCKFRQDHLDQGRVVCLKRIHPFICHHCGNHDYCEQKHCGCKRIEFDIRLKLKIMAKEEQENVIINEISE